MTTDFNWSRFFSRCVKSRIAGGDSHEQAIDVCQGHQYGTSPEVPFHLPSDLPNLPPAPPTSSVEEVPFDAHPNSTGPFSPPFPYDDEPSPTAVKARRKPRTKQEAADDLREVFGGQGMQGLQAPRLRADDAEVQRKFQAHMCSCPTQVCQCPGPNKKSEAVSKALAPLAEAPPRSSGGGRAGLGPGGDVRTGTPGGGGEAPQRPRVRPLPPPARGKPAAAAPAPEAPPEQETDEPQVCPDVLDPVKTSDGVVYPNECFAKLAGAKDFQKMTPAEYDQWAMDHAGIDAPDLPQDRPVRGKNVEPFSGTNTETAGESVQGMLRNVLGEGQPYGSIVTAPTMLGVKMQTDGDGFPFRTQSAEKVYKVAKRLVAMYPEATAGEIKVKAIDKAGVLLTELTPEDDALLDIAINYAQTGRDNDQMLPTPPVAGFSGAFGYTNNGGPPLSPRGYK